jgi:hypothetical protein
MSSEFGGSSLSGIFWIIVIITSIAILVIGQRNAMSGSRTYCSGRLRVTLHERAVGQAGIAAPKVTDTITGVVLLDLSEGDWGLRSASDQEGVLELNLWEAPGYSRRDIHVTIDPTTRQLGVKDKVATKEQLERAAREGGPIFHAWGRRDWPWTS